MEIKYYSREFSYVCFCFAQFGFIAYENEEGKNLFFHMSELEGDMELQVTIFWFT